MALDFLLQKGNVVNAGDEFFRRDEGYDIRWRRIENFLWFCRHELACLSAGGTLTEEKKRALLVEIHGGDTLLRALRRNSDRADERADAMRRRRRMMDRLNRKGPPPALCYFEIDGMQTTYCSYVSGEYLYPFWTKDEVAP